MLVKSILTAVTLTLSLGLAHAQGATAPDALIKQVDGLYARLWGMQSGVASVLPTGGNGGSTP